MRDLSALVVGDRLTRYSRLLAGCFGLVLVALWVTSSGNLSADGKPLGADFITFWSAGRLAIEGQAVAAFDAAKIFAMQQTAAPGAAHVFLWHYPPTFMLAVSPLAALPYLIAYYTFVGFSLALFVMALRPLVPWREAGVLLLALPGTLICVLHGQNSLVSAALLATAILSIRRKPYLAGVCIGLLAYKPQLGVLFPLVLAVTGQWRAMAAAAVTVALFVGASVAAFGTELWLVFFDNLDVVRGVVERGELPWGKMPSAFIFLRMLGVPQSMAYLGQSMVTLAAIAATVLVWWRCGPTLLAGAVLVVATLMLTPYTFDYEMVLITIPLAIIARHLICHGASEREKLLLLVLAASPLAVGTPAGLVGFQFGFIALATLLVWSVRLALATGARERVDIPAPGHATIVGSTR